MVVVEDTVINLSLYVIILELVKAWETKDFELQDEEEEDCKPMIE
jgi:hypothetical protein